MNDVTGNLFSLFCPAWRACLKMFARLFQIKQLKASKKFWEELFASTKNVAKETNRVLVELKMPKLESGQCGNKMAASILTPWNHEISNVSTSLEIFYIFPSTRAMY